MTRLFVLLLAIRDSESQSGFMIWIVTSMRRDILTSSRSEWNNNFPPFV